MKNVAIITYHGAYNYGSVFQAYATQEALKKLGYDTCIINYRMKEQKRYYSLYRTSYGMKIFLKDLLQFPIQNKRAYRNQRFEDFISNYLNLSQEVDEPEKVNEIVNDYQVLLSGSDQIWNKNSNELFNAPDEYMKPYFWAGCKGKKISYASSIGNMTLEDLEKKSDELKGFQHLSSREKIGANIIESIVQKKVQTVLDPTFLLTKQEWEDRFCSPKKERFVLFYSLNGIKMINEWTKNLENLSNGLAVVIKVITPFAYMHSKNKNIINVPDMGPIEFINAIYNAEMIITDSFHGTALSINLNKKFFVLCNEGSTEYRKKELLEKFKLENRIIKNYRELLNRLDEKIDYESVNYLIEKNRIESNAYLSNAIED